MFQGHLILNIILQESSDTEHFITRIVLCFAYYKAQKLVTSKWNIQKGNEN